MSGFPEWLHDRTREAPSVLRQRALEHVHAAGTAGSGFDRLSRAGDAALQQVVGQEGDRSVALDLLAADGLITLALLWCAEHEPSRLAVAAHVLADGGHAP